MIAPALQTLITLYGPSLHAAGGVVTHHQTHQAAVRAALAIADVIAGEPLGIAVTDRQQAWVRVLNPENDPIIEGYLLVVFSVPEQQRLRICSTTLQHLAARGPNRAATVSHLLVSGLARLRRDINPSEVRHAQ